MRIGIIGTGQIGATLVRHYTQAGHTVKMTNASGITKLRALEIETNAKAASLHETVKDVEVLVISIPFVEVPNLARQVSDSISADTIIVDTTNYYPIRDGYIDVVTNGITESAWVSNQFSRHVIKVYNSILAGSLIKEGRPQGMANQLALPVSGDHKASKNIVASLVNDSGFDAVDIGSLSDSWKQQPGSPVYCTDLNATQIRNNLDFVHRDHLAERRELALQFILQQDPNDWPGWYKDCVANNRIVYKTVLNQ